MEKEYSVLFPLTYIGGDWVVVFEKRSRTLKAHRGEISLPGGAIEKGENPKEAAIRETSEELGIPVEDIEVVAEMEGTRTLDGRKIHCHLGYLTADRFSPSQAEVEELLMVPVNHFFLSSISEEMLQSPMGHCVKSYYCDFQTHRIWGITGRLVKNFVDSFVDSFDIIRKMQIDIP